MLPSSHTTEAVEHVDVGPVFCSPFTYVTSVCFRNWRKLNWSFSLRLYAGWNLSAVHVHAWFSTLGPDRRYIILFNGESDWKSEGNRMLSGTSTIIGFQPDPDVWYSVLWYKNSLVYVWCIWKCWFRCLNACLPEVSGEVILGADCRTESYEQGNSLSIYIKCKSEHHWFKENLRFGWC